MNTIAKNTVQCSILEGLQMQFLENSLLNKRTRLFSTSCNENTREHFEHDRVFNNVDVIEDMTIDCVEKPHISRTIELDLKSFKPIKRYENSIKVLMKYDNNIKG